MRPGNTHVRPILSRAIWSIESLETRRMFDFTFFGTSGNDTIEISATSSLTQVRVNGGLLQSNADDDIFINAGGGNDTFRVLNTRQGVIVRAEGEEGNDICYNAGVFDLDATYDGPLFFFGGAGTDTYFAYNQDDSTAAASIDVSGTGITKVGFSAISLYDEIEGLEYWDSNASNRISFTNMHVGSDHVTDLEIYGGGGNDTITNINSADAFGFFSTALGSNGASIDGGIGTDTLLLNSHNTPSADYIFEAGTLEVNAPGVNPGLLNYSGIETIDFDISTTIPGGTADDVFLNGKTLTTSLVVDSGAGNDSWIVGGGDIDANGFLLSNTTLLGGAGSDFVRFADIDDAAGETDTYTFGEDTLAKETAGFNYAGFETQQLITGNLVPAGTSTTTNVVNINAVSNLFTDTEIIGGVSRPCAINVTQGNLLNLRGALRLNLGATGVDSVTINDQALTTTAYTYDVTNNQVRKFGTGHTIDYSGVATLVLNTSNFDDFINIKSLSAGTALTVNANNGTDRITLGQGNLDVDVLHAVTINGGGNGNLLTINNSLDASVESQTLTTTDFTDALTHTYTGITSFVINQGSGGSSLVVSSTNIPTTINGGAGDDVINIGNGSLVSGLGANVTVNGNGGNDSLLLLGQNDSGTRTYAFPAFDQFRFGDTSTGKLVTYSGLEQATLRSGTGRDDIAVTFMPIPLSVFSGSGNDSIAVSVSNATVTVDTGAENPSAPFGSPQGDALSVGDFLGTASVVIPQDDTVINIGVSTGSSLRLANGAILNKTWPTGFFIDLGTNLTGTLDLGSGALLWRDGGGVGILPDFRGLLTRGRNGGAWNGTSVNGAINSSLANSSALLDGVGYGLGSEIAPTSIGGLAINSGDTLLRYTLAADANLDTTVDSVDFNVMAGSFSQVTNSWSKADFNYDNIVDSLDFNLLASTFGQTLIAPPASTPADILSIDEPISETTLA